MENNKEVLLKVDHLCQYFKGLKAVGYDGTISIEHEDGLMSPKEGLEKAISFLKETLIYEKAGEMWWA